MLAPIAKFMANHVVGVEMRHYPFTKRAGALDWLRSYSPSSDLKHEGR
jgi:hypothetical protein